MPQYQGLIDPPIEISSTEQWKHFLNFMKTKWEQDDPTIQKLILRAESELLARELAGNPDQYLAIPDRQKYWALVYPSAPKRFSPPAEWRRALASLRDPKVYPQENPLIQAKIKAAEAALGSRRKEAA